MFTFLNDAEDDPFFGPHMRHMRQMNNMMSSLLADPFGMMGGGGGMLGGGGAGMLGGGGAGMLGGGGAGMLALGGGMLAPPPQRHSSSLMPFMPHMNINRLLSGGMEGGMMPGSSYSSSTVVMSSGPHGRPQVISSTSSTKVGPNGVKETRKTLEDSRTGTKKMAVGHHIGERAHVIEREQNVLSGDQEEHQEFINLDEEEADDFDREFQQKVGGYVPPGGRASIAAPQLALPAPPAPSSSGRASSERPAPRRPIRHHTAASPLASALAAPRTSASVRELYSGAHPQRHKSRHHRSQHNARHSPEH